MSFSSITAYGTAGTWMTARVNVTLIGSGTPARPNVTFTLVPACAGQAWPDTSSIFSPGDRGRIDHQDPVAGHDAALLPGVPENTAVTVI